MGLPGALTLLEGEMIKTENEMNLMNMVYWISSGGAWPLGAWPLNDEDIKEVPEQWEIPDSNHEEEK